MALIKDVAREDATRIWEKYWDGSLPVDPIVIAKSLGIRVWSATMPGTESGRIVREEGKRANIYYSREEPPGRQRFTIAHEIGHWVDRSERQTTGYAFSDSREEGPKDAYEQYADYFASSLLMPSRQFIKMFDDEKPIEDIAQRFGVTIAAARTRARHLGLTT